MVSSLDSTLRLLDKTNGKLLKDYKGAGYCNSTYRIRSTLAARDSVALSGSEDGWIYAWDVLTGECTQRFKHQQASEQARASKKVVSAVACKRKGDEWASAGGDGKSTDSAHPILTFLNDRHILTIQQDPLSSGDRHEVHVS